MAAVSLERSIENLTTEKSRTPGVYSSLKVTGVFVGTFENTPKKVPESWFMGVSDSKLDQFLPVLVKQSTRNRSKP